MNEEDIVSLQSRIAYQEDALNSLNDMVVKQDLELQELRLQLQAVYKKVEELKPVEAGHHANQEVPPHY